MRHYIKSLAVIFISLLLFQIFSTIQVWLSNAELLQVLKALENYDYFSVPNNRIIPFLSDPGTAFAGGVFFTLTVGTFIVLLSFGFSVFFFSSEKNRKIIMVLFVLFVVSAVIFINLKMLLPESLKEGGGEFVFLKGFLLTETISLIVTPAFVFILYRFVFGGDFIRITGQDLFVQGLMLLGLVLFLAGAMRFSSENIFTDFRDRFLVTNRAGMVVNDFYYKYTMYPASVFKPVSDRFPKVCSVITKKETAGSRLIRRRMLQCDYLVLDPPEKKDDPAAWLPDFTIEKKGLDVLLIYRGQQILKTEAVPFTRKPRRFLKEFSGKTDRYSYYRQLTAAGLKTGMPLFFYILCHFLIFGLTAFIFRIAGNRGPAGGLASILGLILCVTAFGILAETEKVSVSKENLSALLASDKTQERIAALRYVDRETLDIDSFGSAGGFSGSSIAEKYWYARALGHSRMRTAKKELLELLRDEHLNVACQALYGLGRQGDKSVIPEITRVIEKTDLWYLQWYGFLAMKRLGWKQKLK